MKKVLYFALVAVMALPLMFACKEKNGPEEKVVYDPEKPEEGIGTTSWLYYWIGGEAKDTVPVIMQNLTGVWQLRAQATPIMDPNNPDSVLSSGAEYDLSFKEEEYFYYYELKEDFTDTLLVMQNSHSGVTAGVSKLEKFPGKWKLAGKQLTINRERAPQSMSETATAEEFTIYLLEKDRMVWKYKENSFAVFVRADKPKEPKNRQLTEVLTSKKWAISYDYQKVLGYVPNPDPNDPSGGTYDTLSTKEDMWKGYELEFKIEDGDSTLIVYDASKAKVEDYAWRILYGDNITYLYFQLKVKEGSKLFTEDLYMEWLDFKDYNKALMSSWEQVEPTGKYEECDMQRYFEIEGAK